MVNQMQPLLHLTNNKDCNQLRIQVIDHDIPVIIKYHSKNFEAEHSIPYIEYEGAIVKEYSGVMYVLMQLFENRTPNKVFEIEETKQSNKSQKLNFDTEGKLKLALMYILGAGFTYLIYQYSPNINRILLSIILTIPLALILFPSLFGKIKNLLADIGTNMNKDTD